jgi:hypothetical protein
VPCRWKPDSSKAKQNPLWPRRISMGCHGSTPRDHGGCRRLAKLNLLLRGQQGVAVVHGTCSWRSVRLNSGRVYQGRHCDRGDIMNLGMICSWSYGITISYYINYIIICDHHNNSGMKPGCVVDCNDCWSALLATLSQGWTSFRRAMLGTWLLQSCRP